MKKASLLYIAVLVGISAIAQKVPDKTGSKVTKEQAQQALDHHNKARKDVGTPPLIWSADLAAYAQAWADDLASRNCAFEHRSAAGKKEKSYGENIFWGSASSYNALNASESWYSEISDYKHGVLTNENWSVAGHYTQMVWRTSKSVGIGMATCATGAVIIVANYDPPGNYLGDKAY